MMRCRRHAFADANCESQQRGHVMSGGEARLSRIALQEIRASKKPVISESTACDCPLNRHQNAEKLTGIQRRSDQSSLRSSIQIRSRRVTDETVVRVIRVLKPEGNSVSVDRYDCHNQSPDSKTLTRNNIKVLALHDDADT